MDSNLLSSTDSATPASDKILLEPYQYLLGQCGKATTTKVIKGFELWLSVPTSTLQVITEVTEMLHNASLMIDDVQDGSHLRRSIPAAHEIYGIPQTINCANYICFLALKRIVELGNPLMVTIFTEELLNLYQGQGIELFWRDALICPTESEYIDMVNNKTSGLLRLAVRLMQTASNSDSDYTPLVNMIGTYYQIRDDYMNLQSDKYSKSKGFCEDLTEGKMSFPIIHAIRSDTSNRQLLNIVSQKPKSMEIKKYALDIIKRTGSFDYVYQVMTHKETEARDEIKRLGGNILLENLLDALHVPHQQG
ncbi:geranylgeranyl pyrophosphate synthase [Chlamydoabsidia padenii]|nr:geranylgeranyl pyrophosphate synthase [Chlamydoabsidia padenii]